VVLAVASLSLACEPQVGDKVLLAGDGILSGASGVIQRELTLGEGGPLVAVNAHAGLGLADVDTYWADRIPDLVEAMGGVDVMVVMLGSADAQRGEVPVDLEARIDAVVAAADPARVLWVTLNEGLPGAGEADREINDALHAAAQRHARVTIVDFGAEVGAHPDYLAADGVHLSPDGDLALAAMLEASRSGG
jgi:lysophospholipase L1-like esterase